ncbi:MAG: cell division protein FtsH, partial [Pyrinomonadaceae bacterium]
LGREISQHRDYSEDTAIKIDQEVQKIVAEQYQRAEQIIRDNKDALIRLAEALLEFETLDSVQIRRVVAGLPIDNDNSASSADDDGSPETEESSSPFKKPILPPITGNNPATA